MQTPEFVGIGEIMTMLNLSKSRVHQLVDRLDFPAHYIRLQMGRVWLSQDVVDWAMAKRRPVTLPRYIPEPPGSVKEPKWLCQVVEPGDLASVPSTQYPMPSGLSQGGSENTITATPVTISSGEEPVVEEQVEKTQSPPVASLPTSTVVPDPPQEAEPPTRRSTIELNRLALAEDWDDLERIYKAAKKNEELPESDLKLVGFAAMVIASQANVPSYRRTKDSMVKAWGEVRRAYTPTAEELVLLAEHVVASAQTPFTPGAVKKFSDFEIAKIRRTTSPKAQPGAVSRWQGSHGVHDAKIAALTSDEKKRYGVAQ